LQKLHLIGQNGFTIQNEMFRVAGGVGHRDQFDTPFGRGAIVFTVITASAGTRNI
jgi:hypothetical protein